MAYKNKFAYPLALLWSCIIIGALIMMSYTVVLAAQGREVKYTSTQLKGKIKDYHWISDKVAILLTDKEVYLSTDGGVSFFEQDSYLCDQVTCVTSLVVSPVDANIVIFVGTGDEHYIATNMKSAKRGFIVPNYRKFKMPLSSKDGVKFIPHPSYKNYWLALVDASVRTRVNNLFVTKDAGATWTLVKDNIKQAIWSNTNANNNNEDKIYAIKTVPAAGYRALFSYDIVTGVFSSDLVTGADSIFHMGKFTFLSTRIDGGYQLYVSTDNSKEFRRVELPDTKAHQKAYVLLDNSEGSVFLSVFEKESLDSPAPHGTVYISDWSGSRYSHSLLYNHGTPPSPRNAGKSDFHKIRAMEGVYIANVISNMEEPKCKKCETDCHLRCHVGSRITFNRGGLWQPIETPATDSHGHRICRHPVSGRCKLHLRGITSARTSPILSHASAIGIIMATGNSGDYLKEESDVNTYLSRDAGLTWDEIAKGAHTYEITDNGALLVMARSYGTTTHIKYSWNQGIEWISSKFTNDTAISVERIHHNKFAPLSKSVMIQAFNNELDSSLMIFADFSSHEEWKDCSGFETPGAPDSDYEIFTPHTYQNDKCMLGRIVQYVRRKRDAKCFNKHADKAEKIRNCQCTYEDYDCEYYYERRYTDNHLECVPSSKPEALEQIEKLKLPPSRCYGYYNETRGYRKVAGNSCDGGIDLSPIPKQCPSTMSTLGILILFLFLSILFSFAGVFLYRNSPAMQNMLKNAVRLPTGSRSGRFQYNPIPQSEDFGLDDEEADEDEPDEFDENSFNFAAVATQRMISSTDPSNNNNNNTQTTSQMVAGDQNNDDFDDDNDPFSSLDQSKTRTISLDADNDTVDPLRATHNRRF